MYDSEEYKMREMVASQATHSPAGPSQSTKAEANYKFESSTNRCENCAHFIRETETLGLCSEVEGVIDAGGTSDHFANKNTGEVKTQEKTEWS